jgi:hypothetical protein
MDYISGIGWKIGQEVKDQELSQEVKISMDVIY